MSRYKFKRKEQIPQLLNAIGNELKIDTGKTDCITYFHEGDTLEVNLETGELDYDPIIPGDIFHSKLSLRLHQWFGKGLVTEVN